MKLTCCYSNSSFKVFLSGGNIRTLIAMAILLPLKSVIYYWMIFLMLTLVGLKTRVKVAIVTCLYMSIEVSLVTYLAVYSIKIKNFQFQKRE